MPGPLRVDAEERRARVATLLLGHKTVRQIAAEVGASRATVARDVQAVRAEWRERRLADVDQHIAEELARLAAIEAAVLPQAQEGKLIAVDRALAIMQRRAALLGLDAPQRREISGPDGGALTVRVVYDDPDADGASAPAAS